MMPKEVLTDRAIRSEVVPGLSLHRICQILERFQPDDFAADPLPKGEAYETAPTTGWAASAQRRAAAARSWGWHWLLWHWFLQPEAGAGTGSSKKLGMALAPLLLPQHLGCILAHGVWRSNLRAAVLRLGTWG